MKIVHVFLVVIVLTSFAVACKGRGDDIPYRDQLATMSWDKIVKLAKKEGEDISRWNPLWKWLKDDKDDYVITTGNADSLTRLIDGEFTLIPA